MATINHALLGGDKRRTRAGRKTGSEKGKKKSDKEFRKLEDRATKLERVRREIDFVDYEILKLLNERIELSLQAKKLKKTTCDRARERQVLRRVRRYAGIFNLVQRDFVERLYIEIMKESRKSQEAEQGLIGFQGEHGAFGEIAAQHYDPHLAAIPCPEFAHVFEGVQKGYLDRGIVPAENSLGGPVSPVNELLIQTDLKVVAAIKLRINHCLLAIPEAKYREIKVVYSHPQALSQCRAFLSRRHLEGRPYYDTAGAARMLANEGLKAAAAIASPLCAELYNLEIMKEDIGDNPSNFTRFFILAREEKKTDGNMCSIVFATPHKAGTLFAVLEIFARARINLTRIESLPDRDDPGHYVFFLDFQIAGCREHTLQILDEVKRKTKMLKYLGCYREEVFA